MKGRRNRSNPEFYRTGRYMGPPPARRETSYVKHVPNHQIDIPREIRLILLWVPGSGCQDQEKGKFSYKNPEPRECQETVEPQLVGG